jgi:SSS family solute:Na+ symporter
MILASFLFIPYYWKSGVYSIPEYLGLRYSESLRFFSAIIMCFFNLLITGVFLWSTGLMIHTFIGIPVEYSILLTAFTVGVYTTSGGLKAVAITDTIQVSIMFIGSFLLIYKGLEKIGGLEIFLSILKTNYPTHLHLFLDDSHKEFPWTGVILGLGFVLSPAYWCTSQVILQRSLAARTVWDSQFSMLFAAFLKTLIPILIVIPGLIALCLNPNLTNSDSSLPWMIKNILPPGISGLLFISFIAALQSSVDSTLNSTSTMVSRDILGVIWKKGRTDQRDLVLGKITTVVSILIGIALAPITNKFEAIYSYVQTILSFFQGPLFSLIAFGILSTIPTPKAAIYSLFFGVLLSAILTYNQVNILYISFYTFVFSSFLLFTISRFTEKLSEESFKKLRGEI